jgi:multidrug efflux pump subunit AcrB
MFNNQGLVKIKIQSNHKDNIETLENFFINIPQTTQKVRLKDITDFIYVPSYTKIIKENGERIRTVFASLDKKIITSAEFLEKIDNKLNLLKEKGIKIIIKGEQKENNQVKKEMTQAGIIAILLIFISLVWMFNSILKPLIIISTIPLSVIGVLIGHKIMGINMTMPSIIGIVGLAGVIVNDGIIMLDFIKNEFEIDKIIEKAKMRIRPILLTSITTILGLFTLIFFASGQALILQPMAITLGFGLGWATILNLFYVPLLYSFFRRQKKE